MRRLLLLFGAVLPWMVIGVIGAGCDGDPQIVTEPGGGSSAIGGGVAQGGNHAEGGAGGGTGGDHHMGGMAPVRIGIVANTSSEMPAAGDQALAELTAFAAGVRAASVAVAWRDVDGEALDALAARVDDYAARDLAVVLDLLVVDGRADLRPDELAGEAWNAPATKNALDASLAALLSATDGELTAVVFGRRVDAYLAEHPDEESAFAELASEGLSQLAAAGVAQGVGLTYRAQDPTTGYPSLAALGDTTTLAYLPGLGLDQVPADVSHAKALDQMIDLADGRPIHLYAAGYPSASALGSSEAIQSQQLDGLFSALESRRAAFPLVVVQQLNDLDPPSCDALVAAQGLDQGDVLGIHLCSTGLRTVDGEAKPAFDRFQQASAHFAQP